MEARSEMSLRKRQLPYRNDYTDAHIHEGSTRVTCADGGCIQDLSVVAVV